MDEFHPHDALESHETFEKDTDFNIRLNELFARGIHDLETLTGIVHGLEHEISGVLHNLRHTSDSYDKLFLDSSLRDSNESYHGADHHGSRQPAQERISENPQYPDVDDIKSAEQIHEDLRQQSKDYGNEISELMESQKTEGYGFGEENNGLDVDLDVDLNSIE